MKYRRKHRQTRSQQRNFKKNLENVRAVSHALREIETPEKMQRLLQRANSGVHISFG
jgi:hypothetical protein